MNYWWQVKRAKKRSSSILPSDLSFINNGDSDSSSPQEVESSSSSCLISPRYAPILYAVIYFSCMVIVELAIEGTQNAFPDLLALPYAMTLFQFSFCFLLPVAISKGETIKKIPKSIIAISPYVVLSLVVFSSTVCKSSSARYVSFPTKVIFKSTKLMPTMLVATIFQNKKFGRSDYLAASLLCAGATGYSWGETTKNNEKNDSYYGIFLLVISVLCDAITPNIKQWLMMNPEKQNINRQIASSPSPSPSPPASPSQSSLELSSLIMTNNNPEKLTSRQMTPSSCSSSSSSSSLSSITPSLPVAGLLDRGRGGLQGLSATTLMTNAYAVGCIGLFAFMASTGHLEDALVEAFENPHLFVNLTLIGTSMSVAVFAHTRLIKESGAVTAVAVTTLRDFATVILSYIVYPKIFTGVHALSGLLVFSGILLSSYTEHYNNNDDRTCTGESVSANNRGTDNRGKIEMVS
jgi:drug/metabolite transporter (DMT)-like permease